MVHAVIRFVEQGVSKEMTEPTLRHDTASRAVHGITCQPEVFDILAPALEICRNHRRHQVKPEKIFPDPKKRDRRVNGRPDYNCHGQLEPDSPSHFPTPDYRVWAEENAQEDERRINQTDRKLEKSSQEAGPTGRVGADERPEFRISLGRKMHVMRLVHDPVETEREQTKNADKHAVEFVQSPALSQETVGSLVKSDQQSVHEMRCHQDKRHGEPEPSRPNCRPDGGLG